MKFLSLFEHSHGEVDQTEKKVSSGKVLYAFGIVFVLIITIASLAVLLLRWSTRPKVTSQPTIVKSEPAPQPVAQVLNRGEWVFEVLNASGTRGEAGRVRNMMEEAGYAVAKVGNSTTSESGAQLFIQEALTSQKDMVLSDLTLLIPGIAYAGILDASTPSARIVLGPSK